MTTLPAVACLLFALQPAPSTPATPPEPAKEPEKKAWDVNAAIGPTKEVALDVTSGTWLSLDVSPDGSTIVFDLLGDLYSLPIAGGEATSLTSGPAWDMQPRFSPDGSRLAFTSDRGGGDNIWTMKPDGSDPKQVTKESFRLLNGPAWLPPAGDYIVARKHFTSRRSLGAGEMWLYHAHGGVDGLQLTTKPTEQKDVNEPAFSPDGRYLYYSWDSTPGGTFEYNKDSTEGIYTISRLDRVTGETETVAAGPGGACRPTPSPDGTSLAFVRRVRFKTCLFIRDLESGVERQVLDDLERDMQESWAIHGVYPSMAWTPDGRSIVHYAQGGFRKVDVADGKLTPIPFRVKTTRTVTEAIRFPVDVAPASFDVKMLRNVVVRPDGRQVAYNALGYIYVKDLPDGAPRRLTTQTDRFEYPATYSRDGSRLLYTTWNDQELATVAIINVDGSDNRTLTSEKGHYGDAAISPDGTTVVFAKTGGGFLVTPAWSSRPGIYKAPADGSAKPSLLTRRGVNPQFGAESDRVYLEVSDAQKENDRRLLISIGLDGREERTHYAGDNTTEFRVSPDGRFLAFAERFNVHVTPFVPTGREVAVGPKMTSQPAARVSKDGNANLQWSGDGRTLFWSLGPTLYSRKLEETFKWLAGADAPAELPPPPEQGVHIGFSHPFDAPGATIALTNATLITMRGDEVIAKGTVVIENNRIVAVGAVDAVKAPAGATVIDCEGRFIMPGIVDVHAHGGQGGAGFTPQANWINAANLAFGVTTIHDPSNDTQSFFAASELGKAGVVTAPRLFSTGTILYGAAGSFKAEVESLEDAKFHLRRMKAVGAFSVKSYNQPRREQRQQVLAAARELGMMVVPEGGSLYQHNMTMVVDGHTGVEHTLPVERIYDDARTLWGATKVGYTPTLLVAYGGLDGEHYWYDRTETWKHERLLRYVPRQLVDPKSRRRPTAPDEDYNVLRCSGIAAAIVNAGGKTHVGAHGQLAGLGAHWELWLLQMGGLTPMQALRAATLDGAFYVGLDKDLGSIEAGKLADLVVLDRNPLENIRHTDSVRYTVANGRVYDASNLSEIAPRQRPGPTFWFHDPALGAANSMLTGVGVGGCVGCGR
jgi:imidazolonepropionase-like amidohydrolase/Tol biopolymer transport system component